MGVEQGAAVPADGRIAYRAAWLLCGLTLAATACAVVLGVLNETSNVRLVFLVGVASSAIVGGMIASRLPANPIGWFFLSSAFCFAAAMLTDQYARYGLVTEPGSLPAAQAMVWPQSWLWVPGAALILVFVPLYFPNGRLVSRRWRPVAWFAVCFCVIGAGYSALRPGEVQASGFSNPLGLEMLRPVTAVYDRVLLPLWLGLLFVSAASLMVRLRRSGREERQQIKWLVFAAALIPSWFLLNSPVQHALPTLFIVIDGLALSAIPVAAGFAILRYRLYDIDPIINRTLVYGALTVCVVALYVLVVGYLGQIFSTNSDLLNSLIATGAVAVLFAPLRDRLQKAVNRLMYGERDDPYRVISRLGERLKATDAPEAVLPTIVQTVAQALKLPHAAIALKRDSGRFEVVTSYGHPRGEQLVVPLSYGTETIGRFILSPRAPGEPFNAADRRLLGDLARYAEAPAYAVRLTSDLQRSRERLVTAREEERRRLRRDLHDGLGPQLATLPLKLDAARNLLAQKPQAADALLTNLKEQVQGAISDIRRVVYDLRPPAIDELGLMAAIGEQAAAYDHSGLRVHVEGKREGLPPLPAAVEVACYRIVQEALTNVVRHARAGECSIRVDVTDGELEVEVADNGVGLPEDYRAGVGLSSMRERAAELGGRCMVHAKADGGTRVLARLPLTAHAEKSSTEKQLQEETG